MLKIIFPLYIVLFIMPKLTFAYLGDYQVLLSNYVTMAEKDAIKTTLVDYQSWAKDKRHQQAMDALKKTKTTALSGLAKMAFWINAYNLLTIDLIIKTGERDSIKNQGSFFKNVWKTHHWLIDNKSYTLDAIEHQILRPMGDARIHMAINCASLSCPDLHNRPYQAKNLDTQLAQQTKRFLADSSKGVRVTEKGLLVSQIFKWFEIDFGGENGVIAFIDNHHSAWLANQDIDDYLPYNWRLNTVN